MKIQISNNSEKASTLDNVRVAKHTMSKNSINLQMLMLRTGLYSDKVSAVIREYLTNARDAHVDAGHSKAIDITVPNRFGNDIVIRDYGTGMSPDFIEKVYVQYTASTKRDSEEMTGGWGIGSKSGYAYSDSFTVISIHNGVRYTWLAQSHADGSGDFSLVSSVETAEPSGVEIRLSLLETTDFYRFIDAVKHFSQFIDMPVNLNGFLQEKSCTEKLLSSDDFTVAFKEVKGQDRYSRKVFIVQGGVPYPVGISAIKNELEDSHVINFACSWNCYSSLCIFVPPGTFMPDISREKIQFDASGSTLAAIVNYISLTDAHIVELFESYMSASKTSNHSMLSVSLGHSIFSFSSDDGVDGSLKEFATPLVRKIFSKRIKKIFEQSIRSKKDAFENIDTTEYRHIERDYDGNVKTTKMYRPINFISQKLSRDKDIVIAFSQNSYKRNLRISSLSPKPDILVHSKTFSFEQYKKFINDSLSNEEYTTCGVASSRFTIIELPTISPSTRETGIRRATKFLKVDSIGYCGTVSTLPIPKDEVETDAKVVFGLLFRNKIVNENGIQIPDVGIARAVATSHNSNIVFRVIKLSDFKKNKTLTRGKVDYSEMIRIETFSSIISEYNAYQGVNLSFEKTVTEAGPLDESYPKSILSAIKMCRDRISIMLDDISLEMYGLNLDHMIDIRYHSDRTQNKKFLIDTYLESILNSDSGYNAIKKFISQEISSYDDWVEINRKVLVLSKMIPNMFE